MNSRAFTLSLIIAGIAMFMVYSYMEGRESLYIQKFGKETAVLVAKSDIKALEPLDESKVIPKNIPKAFVVPGHVGKASAIFGTIASAPIKKGEQISVSRLTYPGASTGLSRQVSLGKRAIAININDEQGVGRLIKPGDRVDIMAMIDYAGGRSDLLQVRTILQDVLILSTGLNVSNNTPLVKMKTQDGGTRDLKLNTYTSYSSVTIELDPFQVQKVVFLTQKGSRLFLSLRNNDDKKITRITGTTLFDVLGEEAGEAKAYFSTLRGGAQQK